MGFSEEAPRKRNRPTRAMDTKQTSSASLAVTELLTLSTRKSTARNTEPVEASKLRGDRVRGAASGISRKGSTADLRSIQRDSLGLERPCSNNHLLGQEGLWGDRVISRCLLTEDLQGTHLPCMCREAPITSWPLSHFSPRSTVSTYLGTSPGFMICGLLKKKR